MLIGINRISLKGRITMCKQNSCSCGTSIIISVIIGIGVAVIFSLGFLTNAAIALFIAFGISAVALLTLLLLIPIAGSNISPALKKCMCIYGKSLIAGAVGTLVTTLAALSLELVASTALIIIFFLIGTFLSFLIISIVQFLWCVINFDCCRQLDPCR